MPLQLSVVDWRPTESGFYVLDLRSPLGPPRHRPWDTGTPPDFEHRHVLSFTDLDEIVANAEVFIQPLTGRVGCRCDIVYVASALGDFWPILRAFHRTFPEVTYYRGVRTSGRRFGVHEARSNHDPIQLAH